MAAVFVRPLLCVASSPGTPRHMEVCSLGAGGRLQVNERIPINTLPGPSLQDTARSANAIHWRGEAIHLEWILRPTVPLCSGGAGGGKLMNDFSSFGRVFITISLSFVLLFQFLSRAFLFFYKIYVSRLRCYYCVLFALITHVDL